jgi:hypothetical protein
MKSLLSIIFLFSISLSVAATSLSTSIQPDVPSQDDAIAVVMTGELTGGDKITDTAVSVTGNSITVSVSVAPCIGICPSLLELVSIQLPCGKLAAGDYTLHTFIYTVYDTAATPDTVTETNTTQFTVHPSQEDVPRMVGFHVSDHGWKDDTNMSYYFTNGDTLSVVSVFEQHCCALFTADVSIPDDTVTVTLRDTGVDMCDCGHDRFYATVSLTNVTIGHLPIRIVHTSANYPDYEVVTMLHTNTTSPAVCINNADSTTAGFRLFVDDTWFEYEINSPFITAAGLLRLQPNPEFPVGTDHYLYIDDIVYLTLTEYNQIDAIDTLEDFENEPPSEWTLKRFRDGSSLDYTTISTDSSNVLKMTYSNQLDGGCSNYMYKTLPSHETDNKNGRLILHAATVSPHDITGCPAAYPLTHSKSGRITMRVNRNHQPSILLEYIPPASFTGNSITLSVFTLQGRQVFHRTLHRTDGTVNSFRTTMGKHTAGSSGASGNYIVRFSSPDEQLRQCILLAKAEQF